MSQSLFQVTRTYFAGSPGAVNGFGQSDFSLFLHEIILSGGDFFFNVI